MNAKFLLHLLSFTFLLSLLPPGMQAASLSPEQALQRVQSSGPIYRMSGDKRYALEYTGKADGENAFYVFNNGENGFIVASADDRMPALLGYSDKGAADIRNASPEFKWWLSQYAEQTKFLYSSDAPSNSTYSETRADKASIPELLTTKWDQIYPYNLLCPYDGANQSVTGCVATAMAQVINFHRYPTKGSGYHSYQWNGRTLDYNYSNAYFEYHNMLDIYDDNADQVKKEAVANLMYACGISVDMEYTSVESGASSNMVARAVKDYFNYGSGIVINDRVFYSDEEWNDLVYGELKANRPVLYSGTSEQGGHMFVCDGYDNGYFHMNWGWSGSGNGWFLLSALNPKVYDVGGYEEGYNANQSIITGIRPDANASLESYPLYAAGVIETVNVVGNSYVELYFKDHYGLYNYSPEEITTKFYLKAVAADGREYLSEEGVDLNFPASEKQMWGYWRIGLDLPSVGAGDYKAYIVFDGPRGQKQQVKFPLSCGDFINMRVDAEGNYTFYYDELQQPDIRVSQLSALGEIISGVPTDFNISFDNIGQLPYSGDVYILCLNSGTEETVAQHSVQVSLNEGESYSETVNMTFDVAPGDYVLRCFDMFGNSCSIAFPIAVKEFIEEIKIEVTELEPLSEVISGQDAEFYISLKNEGNVNYDGFFYICMFMRESDEHQYYYKIDLSEPLAPGEEISGTVTLMIDIPDGDYDLFCLDKFEIPCSIVSSLAVGALEATPEIFVTELKPQSDVFAGESAMFDISIKNDGNAEYSGYITVYAFDPESDTPLDWIDVNFSLAPNTFLKGEVPMTFDLLAGDYNLICVDMFDNVCSDWFQLTVKEKTVEATGVVLDLKELSLVEGDSKILKAAVAPENATDKSVIWSTSDPAVATVAYGVVTAVAPGIAVITASTANGHAASCNVMVSAKVIDVPEISINKTRASLVEGETLTLTATVASENAADKNVAWSTSAPSVATVSDGVVTAVSPGTAVITASTANGHTASCTVTVSAKAIDATGISLDKTEASLVEGETLTLTATVAPDNAADKSVTWSSSDSAIATVADGVVTAVAPGTAVITASTANGHTASCNVTVSAKVIDVTGITLDKTEAALVEGETLTLTATVVPDNAADKYVTWSSSNPSVATVADGVVTAVAPGTAVMTVSTTNGHTASCNVMVSAKVIDVTGIFLDKTETSLVEGETLTLTATVAPENASDKSVTWSSSDSAIATVADGVVTAVAPGTAVITASTANGHTASCIVAVEPKIVYATSITLDKTSVEIEEGGSFTLVATVLPDETTDKTVEWSSSDESVAIVDQYGNVSVITIGSAVITARTTDGSILYAECAVNGISSVMMLVSGFGPVDIFTLDGLTLRRNADSEFVDNLDKGSYIIRRGSHSVKFIKR